MSARDQLEKSLDERRYRLVPQLRCYEDFLARSKIRWLPHVMYFHPADYRSPVVNSDAFGFRYSETGGRRTSVEDNRAERVRLLVGGSVAMGLGATEDAKTIASQLNRISDSDDLWLNFGARGYTFTQELILFLLMRPHLGQVKEVVLLSGLNNLVLADANDLVSDVFGAFYYCDSFYEKMHESNADFEENPQGFLRRFLLASEPPAEYLEAERTDEVSRRVRSAAETARRDLTHWTALASAYGFTLTYALQPAAGWVDRTPHPNESALFDLLDSHPKNSARALRDILSPAAGRQYREQLASICDDLNIKFLDLSAYLSRREFRSRWLFVDRAHFTDEGYACIAELIARETSSLHRFY